MVSDLQYPEIAAHAEEVLRSLIFKETDISASNERWFTVRIMPYRTFDDRIDGLVITFIDISKARQLEIEIASTNFNQYEKQSSELATANKKLVSENKEKQKRADELVIANKQLLVDNKEKKKLEAELTKANNLLKKHNLL